MIHLQNEPQIPDSYDAIFDKRGTLYHQAMLNYPDARAAEFEYAVAPFVFHDGFRLADAPAGGGYLAHRLPSGVEYHALETTPAFHRIAQTHLGNRATLIPSLAHSKLPAASFDGILSLTGLHHITERAAIYRQWHHLLRDDGLLVIAEVAANSLAAVFLNGFVDRHSSHGHRGCFLTSADRDELRAAGFAIVEDCYEEYPWVFRDTSALAEFCSDLFGLDRATHADVIDCASRELGISTDGQRCLLRWGLQRITLRKMR